MNYLITRHPGALRWLQQQVAEPFAHLLHLESAHLLQPSDAVYGTLPIHLIAAVCAQGARYFHLEIDLPEHLRGQELSAEQLTHLGAQLIEYRALHVVPDEVLLVQAKDYEVQL